MNFTDIATYFPITNPTWIFFVVLCIILFAPMLFERLKIPHIIGMVIAGIVVGEYGLNILDRDGSFELFGRVGLYYIMFTAGLGMDIGSLQRNLSKSALFGILSFGIPFISGILVSYYLLGFSLPASTLMGCILSSHTLVTFPIVSKYGLTRHIGVTFSVGSTMLALLIALLILAGISGAYTGDGNSLFWVKLATKCILFCLCVLYVFPYVIRSFFRKFADNVLQYIFVLSIMFFAAAISEMCGLEGIFGAFLAGLVFNRYIPQSSPLMNRIDFVGNALFIPYFLIGVGMLINVHLLFEKQHVLLVVLIVVITATITKFLASFVACKVFKLDNVTGTLMFGLTNAHAAGALAMVMVGTKLEIAPGQYLMTAEVLNAVVMLILFSCIISSFATDYAARRIAMSDVSREEKTGDKEKILVCYASPSNVSLLTNVAIMVRNVKSKAPIVGVNVVLDDENSARAHEQGRKSLEEASNISSSADVKMEEVSRLTTNVANGIIHTLKEFTASELLLGLHQKKSISDSFFGQTATNILASTSYQLMIVKSLEPINTIRRIHLVVPIKAEYEIGFHRWVDRICRLAGQLDCRIIFYAHPTTKVILQRYVEKKHSVIRTDYVDMNLWNELPSLASKVGYDHLLAIVSARRGALSHQPTFERLGNLIERNFSNSSILIIYPEV